MEIPSDSSLKSCKLKPTIPQISNALSDLFSNKHLESKEMLDYIKEVYNLIDLITKNAPDGLRLHLLWGPSNDAHVKLFIQNLREEYEEYYNEAIINEIFEKYTEIFERGGEGCVKQWKEIVSKYNPYRLNQLSL